MRFRAFLWSDFRLLIESTRIVSLTPRYLQLQDFWIYQMLGVNKANQIIDLNADNAGVQHPDFWIWRRRHEVGAHSRGKFCDRWCFVEQS